MAAENFDDHPAPPQLSHPEYPEMITAAIEALNDGTGSSKAAISDYIESTYGDLPPDHGELLSEHLGRMRDSGGLAMVNDNYVKVGAAPPAKRGRGRPPKAKPAGAGPVAPPADGTVASPPRGRGRPPKSRDPLAPPPQPKPKSPSKSGRPRGRPPKRAKTTPSPAPTSAQAPATGAPRGRGRPPKVKPAVAPVGC